MSNTIKERLAKAGLLEERGYSTTIPEQHYDKNKLAKVPMMGVVASEMENLTLTAFSNVKNAKNVYNPNNAELFNWGRPTNEPAEAEVVPLDEWRRRNSELSASASTILQDDGSEVQTPAYLRQQAESPNNIADLSEQAKRFAVDAPEEATNDSPWQEAA